MTSVQRENPAMTSLRGAALPFMPPRPLRNANVQTVLARWQPAGMTRSWPRNSRSCSMPARTQPASSRIIRCGCWATSTGRPRREPGAGAHAPRLGGMQPLGPQHRGHQRVLQAGYDVFRLNLRDHGPGIHLDPQRSTRASLWARCWTKRPPPFTRSQP
ncbi:MAG: hypothetical protein R2838_08555 [Caldilineaceae bacterium]